MNSEILKKRNGILTLLGAVGVVSSLVLIPQMVSIADKPLPFPLAVVQLISMLQLLILVTTAVLVGSFCSSQIGLQTPLLDALLNKDTEINSFSKRTIVLSVVGGFLGAFLIFLSYSLFKPHLPLSFLENSEQLKLPWFTRLLYGGITEEILMRWGVMSLLVWIPYRIFQKGTGAVKSSLFVVAILISSVLFGIGHLPVVSLLSTELIPPLVGYIVITNSLFGFIAGTLFWKRGLESAMIAHITAHLLMIVFS